MMTTFVQFVYVEGEWSAVPPFGDTPIDQIKAGDASAGAIVMLTEVSGMTEAIERLAAQLMEEIHQMRTDGRKLLGEQDDLEDGGQDDPAR